MSNSLRIGIDLGGTKIEGVVLDLDKNHQIISRRRIPTNSHLGYNHILASTASLIHDICETVPPDTPVGIGMPGSLTQEGKVKNSNTVCLNDQFFRQELQAQFSKPLAFANDANCFALAEATFGAGKGYPLVFGVIMGTGVGGGIVINGQVREGPQSICGEWGHTLLWPDDQYPCYCGKSGCTELFLSGPGVENHYQRLGGPPTSLPEILNRQQNGEKTAILCVDSWMDNFARALSNVINILDPDAIVLGGGVSNCSCLYEEGTDKIEKYLFSDVLTTPILRHTLGDSAGVIGAALLP